MTENPLATLIEGAERLRGTVLRSYSDDQLRQRIAWVRDHFPFAPVDRTQHQVWWRARICEGGTPFNSLRDLIYPDSSKVKNYGRANIPNKPVLYAAWNESTAIDEVNAKPGDVVQIIALRVKPNERVQCIVVGEYQSIWASGASLINSVASRSQIDRLLQQSDIGAVTKRLYCDSFLRELFARSVDMEEYRLTALISEWFLEERRVGVLYPSVRIPRAINAAFSKRDFDRKFEVLGTRALRVEHYSGYGIYESTRIASSCDFQRDGAILWDSKRDFAYAQSITHGAQVSDPNFVGWTVPLA